jgi:hypothetical protein
VLVLDATNGRLSGVDDVVWALGWGVFGGTGFVIVRLHPRHRVGWAFSWIGLFGALSGAAISYALLSLDRPLPFGDVLAWVGMWMWAPPLGLVVLAVAVFPTGRAVNRFFTGAAIVGVTVACAIAVVLAVVAWPLRDATLALPGVADTIDNAAARFMVAVFPLLLLSAVVSLCGLLVRFRRAGGVERQQLKWLAMAAVVMAPAIVALQFVPDGSVGHQAANVLGAPAWLAVAAGIAVLRYRLYDIDRILSRTLSYAVVTAVLLGVYSASVVSFGAVGRAVAGGSSDLVVALSTLLVAAAFQPVRRRVQAAVDRRFNRARVDGLRAAEDFGRRLRDEVDLATVVADLRRTAVLALEPATVSVVTVTHASDRM